MGMFKVGDLLERRVGKRKESAVVESIFETDGHTLIKARIVVIDEGRVLKTRVQKTLKVFKEIENADKIKDDDFVRWNSSGGKAQGRVKRIMREGVLNIPNSSFKINASPEDPAVLIQIYKEGADGWKETSTSVGHKMSTLSLIAPLVKKSRLIKQASEERFTLAPWYIPDKYDAQNEWTDAIELQKALWDYVKSGDRDIRLQHQKDIKAGEWVEAMTLPYEWTTPVQKSNGSNGSITYPAGTVLMGVVWEPWAWEMVKKGDITGFSIGGSAERLDLEMDAQIP